MTARSIALYAGGNAARSFLARLPGLAHWLGPVAASSYRVASRIANRLGAGFPVPDSGALGVSRVVLVCVPDPALPSAVEDLARAPGGWSNRSVLLCESALDSTALEPLRLLGAAAASLNPIAGADDRLVAEGDPAAIRDAKRLARAANGTVTEIARGSTALYAAGVSFATSLFAAQLAACAGCLAEAGCPAPEAARIAEVLYQRSLRAWANAGRNSWSGPLSVGDGDSVARELEALRKHSPQAAAVYVELALFALQTFDRHEDLAARLRAAVHAPPAAR